ncbi:hypothetical protein DSO57_1034227 [Entomophthora muscae]|uniref:Uncharacterized protein n=1 Tax=Entomophthora muscae TaxID=34485 RepID=A0ACC2TB46_9FUNG|nr:hypothetical protein DSO57_1034227 [Entomophthora muscae]
MNSYLYDYNIIPGDGGFKTTEHDVKPFSYLKQGPKHTSRWWQNLVLGQGTAMVALYPYIIRSMDSGFRLGYPRIVSTESFVMSTFEPDWDINFGRGRLSKAVVAEDDLSCTFKMDQVATLPLVRGSPYVTMELKQAHPTFKSNHTVLSATQTSDRQMTVQLSNDQVWVFFTSEPTVWTRSFNGIHLALPYTGTLRAAYVNAPVERNMKILETYSNIYPVSGHVTYEFPSPEVALINFNFETKGTGDLLMFTLSHQQDILVNPHRVGLTGYSNIKGPLSAVKGLRWTIKEKLTSIAWSSPNKINPKLIPRIKEAVREECNTFLNPAIRGSYSFGKVIASFARIALIAEEVGETAALHKTIASLKAGLEPWLTGKNENALVYERTWGGIVTSDGLKDHEADFGNGMYNDHHFHYGYFLYAAAVVGKYDPAWLEKWKDQLILLVRDFANPNPNDKYFPRFRHKDFYDGHSWAAGIYEFIDNRNQESTSESVNAYYAMYLLAIALNDQPMTNLANLLLMTEIRSAQTYWHMYSGHSVYPEVFAKQKTAGIVWGTKVDYATWFGPNVEYVHGIQLLPFTPISHLLLEKPWMKEAYPVLATSLNRTNPPILGRWRTYVHMAHAIVHPEAAYTEFSNSPQIMDEGNSLTNSLYWFATQP